MRIIASIDGLFRNEIGDELFDDLVAIYPQGQAGDQGHAFWCRLPQDDDRSMRVLRRLEIAGLCPWAAREEKKKGKEYLFQLVRVYDESDLEACEYLELAPPQEAYVKSAWRRPQDEVMMIDEPSDWDIVRTIRPSCFAISDRLKRALEDAKLQNLNLRPVQKRYESFDYNLYDEEDIWWELRSDLVLPPLAPSVTLVDKNFAPFTGDFSKGCMPQEGWYVHPELHYKAEDLAKVEPFDLAHTYEMFGGLPNEYDRPLVASQRFYQVCKEHGVETGWVPIRIDA